MRWEFVQVHLNGEAHIPGFGTRQLIIKPHLSSFSYQAINTGVYIGNGDELLTYPMKPDEELKNEYYEWAKSARII